MPLLSKTLPSILRHPLFVDLTPFFLSIVSRLATVSIPFSLVSVLTLFPWLLSSSLGLGSDFPSGEGFYCSLVSFHKVAVISLLAKVIAVTLTPFFGHIIHSFPEPPGHYTAYYGVTTRLAAVVSSLRSS